MNEQDKKLLELYEKDIKKKKIFFCFVAIMFIIVISFYGFYTNYKQSFQNNAEKLFKKKHKTISLMKIIQMTILL